MSTSKSVIDEHVLDIVRCDTFLSDEGMVLVTNTARRCVSEYLATIDVARLLLEVAREPRRFVNDISVVALTMQAVETINGNDLLWVCSADEDVLSMALMLCRVGTTHAIGILESSPRLRQSAINYTREPFLNLVVFPEAFAPLLQTHLLPVVSEWLHADESQKIPRLIALNAFYTPSRGVCLPDDYRGVVNRIAEQWFESELVFEAEELRARAEQAVGFAMRRKWFQDTSFTLYMTSIVEYSPSSFVTFSVPFSVARVAEIHPPQIAAEFEVELRKASIGFKSNDHVYSTSSILEECEDENSRKKIHSTMRIRLKSLLSYTTLDSRTATLHELFLSKSEAIEMVGFLTMRRGCGVVMLGAKKG